ncbi:hypothetical protein KPL70_017832 [Citrus sinensis]|nr:hypothetical protein KPL70_017832 [Citrus sinensis]
MPLLHEADKNVIDAGRASWRIVSSIKQEEESRGNQDYVSVIKEYRSKIEAELTEICGGILKLLDQKLVPAAAAADSKCLHRSANSCCQKEHQFWVCLKNCHTHEWNKLSHASRFVQQPALLKFSQVSSSPCVGSDLPHHAAASKSQHSSRSVGSDLPHAAIALSPTAIVIFLLRKFV